MVPHPKITYVNIVQKYITIDNLAKMTDVQYNFSCEPSYRKRRKLIRRIDGKRQIEMVMIDGSINDG